MRHLLTPLAIDIGGEGRHAHAWNVNPAATKTVGPQRGEPIPRLIRARATRLPFADASASEVIVERTPLSRAALLEIRRILAPGARLILRHVPLAHRDRHALACQLIAGKVVRTTAMMGRQQVLETVIELPTPT
jgi:ubiquinone/menaquinone biosynthesis C-methylase UbiE